MCPKIKYTETRWRSPFSLLLWRLRRHRRPTRSRSCRGSSSNSCSFFASLPPLRWFYKYNEDRHMISPCTRHAFNGKHTTRTLPVFLFLSSSSSFWLLRPRVRPRRHTPHPRTPLSSLIPTLLRQRTTITIPRHQPRQLPLTPRPSPSPSRNPCLPSQRPLNVRVRSSLPACRFGWG